MASRCPLAIDGAPVRTFGVMPKNYSLKRFKWVWARPGRSHPCRTGGIWRVRRVSAYLRLSVPISKLVTKTRGLLGPNGIIRTCLGLSVAISKGDESGRLL